MSATPFLDAVREIEALRSDAATKLHKLLESRGWKSTSQTPGCRWMFEKEIGGRVLLTDPQTALAHELEITAEQYDEQG